MEIVLLLVLLCGCLAGAQRAADTPCGSCKNQCGRHISYCGCDSLCKLYNDCCLDFEAFCPAQKINGTVTLLRFQGISVDKISQCHSVDLGTATRNVPLVTSCRKDPGACRPINVPATGSGSSVSGSRTMPGSASPYTVDVTGLVPVTEVSTGLNFVSTRCAECNGVKAAVVWKTFLLCDDLVYKQLGISNSTENSEGIRHATLQQLMGHPNCKLSIKVPSEAQRPCDPDLVTTCADESAWNQRLCTNGLTDYVNDGVRSYRNKKCAACNTNLELQCGIPQLLYSLSPVIYGKFSLTLLLDYSGSGLMLKSGQCDVGFMKIAHDCLPITCPDDFELKGSECVEIPKFNANIKFYVNIKPGKSENIDKIKFLLKTPDFILETVHNILLDHYDEISNLIIRFNTNGSIETYSLTGVHLSIPGSMTYTVHNMTTNHTSASPPLVDLAQSMNATLLKYLRARVATVSSVEVGMKPFENEDLTSYESSLKCKQIVLARDQFEIRNNSIYVFSTGQDIELQHVRISAENGSAAVCDDAMSRRPINSSNHLGITTIVVLSVSVLCLLVRLVLQGFVTAFHTAPMKVQFCLSVSLFTGFLAFLVNPFLTEDSMACHALGIYIHWVFLLAFCWMMVIAFDMWWIFRPSGGFMKLNEGDGFFWRYLIVAVLCASVVTSVAILFEYVDISPMFKPNYGDFLCFFNNTRALLIFFVLPLVGIVLVNLIFFSVTCWNLHQALNSMQKFQQQKWRHELCLYIRLFSLMGITWVFGLVAPLLPTSDVLWYLFILFNGLQGLYIFLAYVCTKKVWNELKRLCGKQKGPRTQSVKTSRTDSLSSSRGSKKRKNGDSFRSYTSGSGDHSHSAGDTTDGNRTLSTSASGSGYYNISPTSTLDRKRPRPPLQSTSVGSYGTSPLPPTTDGNLTLSPSASGYSAATNTPYITDGTYKLPQPSLVGYGTRTKPVHVNNVPNLEPNPSITGSGTHTNGGVVDSTHINGVVDVHDTNAAVDGRPTRTNGAVEGRPTRTNGAVDVRPTRTNAAVDGRPTRTNGAVDVRPTRTNGAVNVDIPDGMKTRSLPPIAPNNGSHTGTRTPDVSDQTADNRPRSRSSPSEVSSNKPKFIPHETTV